MYLNIQNEPLHITKLLLVMESYLTRRILQHTAGRAGDGFVYILSGQCHYTFSDGTGFTVRAGDLLYLAKGAVYQMDVDCDRYRYIFCDFFFSSEELRQSFVLTPKNSREFEKCFRRLKNSYQLSGASRTLSCMSLLYQIYAMVMEERQTHYIPGSARAKIKAAQDQIRTHLADPQLRVSQLARDAGMSEVHFRKLFRSLYGVTPARYIIGQRIAYGKKLLEMEEFRLEDVALQAGFATLPYFCKVFKAETGTTPAAYRNTILK